MWRILSKVITIKNTWQSSENILRNKSMAEPYDRIHGETGQKVVQLGTSFD